MIKLYSHLNEEFLTEMVEIGRLDAPEYFQYGNHKDTLNHKELKKMINFLESPHKYFGKFGLTNWNVICVYWGDDNPQYAVDPELPMPDYKNMLN